MEAISLRTFSDDSKFQPSTSNDNFDKNRGTHSGNNIKTQKSPG